MPSQTTLVSSTEIEIGDGSAGTASILLGGATTEAALKQEPWLEVGDLVALYAKDELASQHLQQGRILEAQRLCLSAWDLRKRMFGSDHPETLESLHNLADTYFRQGQWSTAENLELQILSSRKRSPSQDNPAIINSLCNLACIYDHTNQLLQAEHFAEQAYCLSRNAFGDTDSLTLDIGNFIAMVRGRNTHSLTIGSNQAEEEVHHARSVNELETLVLDSVARLQSRPVFNETMLSIIGTHTVSLCEVEEVFKHLINRGCVNFTTQLDLSQFPDLPFAGGRFGDVWCGRLTDSTQVAVKCLRAHALKDQPTKSVKRAARELYSWSKAKHIYVLDLMGVAMFRGRLAMISPWMSNGTLEDYAREQTSPSRWRLCIQVAEGLSAVHASRMVHGDLKAKNILVCAEGRVKLSDFGNSIFVSECSLEFTDTTNTAGGTTRWMKAPELLDEDEDEDTNRQAADIYALGMEVMTAKKPYFECKKDAAVIKAVNQGQYPRRPDEFSENERFGDQRWDLLLGCWRRDPDSRPKAVEVMETVRIHTQIRWPNAHSA
ncbi:hypothetical protein FRC10_002575 [Ceratobasidium sp. 414]|nr:hypothetical protein FRC10_002575 [Ceratobasidium sp. 414]